MTGELPNAAGSAMTVAGNDVALRVPEEHEWRFYWLRHFQSCC